VSLRYDEIAEILKIIDGSSCDEVIVETGDIKLMVRKSSAAAAPARTPAHEFAPQPAPPAELPSPAPASVPRAAPPSAMPGNSAAKAARQIEVVAPMVGTFYRAPAPDAPPFVEPGSTVHKGDPLCVIEVMKLFTTIAAEHDGRIVEIGADDAELVEYGRTLFVIEPA
jgi:acetyl-CoA carboxylase biotin carboxyl carrier protein